MQEDVSRACSRDRVLQLCTCCVHVCTGYKISVVFSLQSITASIGIPNFYFVFLMVPLNSVSSGSMKWMPLNSRIVELRFLESVAVSIFVDLLQT